jgi:hypothetical protein
MFTELHPIENPTHVATIGGRNTLPSGIGKVKWSWSDDNGKKHEYTLEKVYYFPQSPVNILSIIEFAQQLKDEEGTGIDTKAFYSRFYWDSNKYSRRFDHSASNLPELPINSGTGAFAWFLSKFSRQCDDTIHHHCCYTNKQLSNLTDENAVSDDSESEEIFLESIIYPNEHMIYKREGRNSSVKVLSSSMVDEVLQFSIQFPDGSIELTTREFLHRPDQPEIANIPVTTQDYKQTASTLSDEELDSLAHPKHLTPHEQEFLDMHNCLFHLPYSIMFRLAKIGVLPKYFTRLINRPPPCASCVFGIDVILMRDLGTESTMAAKREFEEKCATKGVKVEHYHADNGRFAEPAWKEDCKNKGQKLTFLWCWSTSSKCNCRTKDQRLDTYWTHIAPPCNLTLA